MGRPVKECESHVPENERDWDWIQSTAGHVKSRWEAGGTTLQA